MRQKILYITALFSLLLYGCNSDSSEKPLNFSESKVQMKFILDSKEKSGYAQFTTLFSGRNIRWFDESTGEIKFQDTPESPAIISSALKSTAYINFYIDNELLFSAKTRTTTHSDYYNDVVLLVDFENDRYFIKDGYPPLDENEKDSSAQLERNANWAKIKQGYQKFIDHLRKEDRIK